MSERHITDTFLSFLADVNEKARTHYLERLSEYGDAVLADDSDDATTIPDVSVLPRVLSDLVDQFANAAINLCGSPIEQMMLAALCWEDYGYRASPVEIWDTTMPFGRPMADVVISPQHEIAGYRADFAIFVNMFANQEIRLVVECDGHDFHEKTKEQAARDKKRDRDMQIAGWNVLRFTGSEIWRDIGECGGQVGWFVCNKIESQLAARRLIRGPSK